MIKKAKRKVVVSVRIDPEVLERLKKLKVNVSATVAEFLASIV